MIPDIGGTVTVSRGVSMPTFTTTVDDLCEAHVEAVAFLRTLTAEDRKDLVVIFVPHPFQLGML